MSTSEINNITPIHPSGVQAFILTIIELHDIWTKICNRHRIAFSKLEKGGKMIEEAFYKYTGSLVADCSTILQTLANIKLELEIAKETETLDLINLTEIKQNCDTLLVICKEKHTQNWKIQKSIILYRNRVEDSKKRVVWKILDPNTTLIATGCASAIYPGLFTSELSSSSVDIVSDMCNSFAIGSAGGAIFAGMLNFLVNRCYQLKLYDVLQDLNRAESKLREMQNQSYIFMRMTRNVIRKVTNYAESAAKNSKYRNESNTRVKHQAEKMINETSELQCNFKKIKSRAHKYCIGVERELLGTNPQLVLDNM